MKKTLSYCSQLLAFGILLLMSGKTLSQSAVVEPFPPLVDEPLSTTYTVKVNGQTVPVMKYEAGRAPGWGASSITRSVGMAQFAFAGEVEIEITMNPGVPSGYILSPASYGLQPVVSGKTIKFSLDRPRKLMLHYGGEWGLDNAEGVTERLLIFAEPLADDVPDPQAADVIDLGQQGIDNKGKSFVADALQQAIDDAASLPGGGTVYVPAGTYNIDKGLSMRSNVNLYLASGCLIRGTTVKLDYENASEGVIGFHGISNAKLFGPGTVHANGSAFRKDADGSGKDYDHTIIVWLREANECVIKDVTLRDAANIHVFIEEFSEQNYVYNAKLVTDSDYPNTDGVNPNQASNNVIENCFIHNTDDPIAAGYNQEIENITVKNCVFWTYQGALKVLYQPFFPETAARNISFENSDLIYSTGVGSVSGGGRGPHEIKDIFYKNIRSEEVRQHQFQIRTTKDGVAPWDNGVYGKVKDIYIQRVTSAIQGVPIFGEPSYLLGKPDDSLGSHTTENVVFRNYQVEGKTITSLSELQAAGFETNQYLENIQFTQPEETEVNVEATNVYASESGTASAFKIVRTGNTDASLTLKYTLRGTAQNGVDYQTLSGTVTLAAGASSALVPIDPVADQVDEPSESVFLTLEGEAFSTNYLLGKNHHAVIVIGDAPSVTTAYTIRARGLQGTEQMALLIGGQTVQSWTVSKGMQNYSYTGSESGTVRVAITNDQGKGHDLVVDKLTVDGAVYQAEAQAINTGVWQKGSCGGSYSQWLHCSGYIEFEVEAANARQADQRTKKVVDKPLSGIRIFPNPLIDGELTLQLGSATTGKVEVHDLSGRLLLQQRFAQQQQVGIRREALSKGLLMLTVRTAAGSYHTKLMVE
jgi:polygalacturonase